MVTDQFVGINKMIGGLNEMQKVRNPDGPSLRPQDEALLLEVS
jgi:hypothetical protein